MPGPEAQGPLCGGCRRRILPRVVSGGRVSLPVFLQYRYRYGYRYGYGYRYWAHLSVFAFPSPSPWAPPPPPSLLPQLLSSAWARASQGSWLLQACHPWPSHGFPWALGSDGQKQRAGYPSPPPDTWEERAVRWDGGQGSSCPGCRGLTPAPVLCCGADTPSIEPGSPGEE